MFGQIVFPSLNWVPYVIRTTLTTVTDLLLLLVSIRLLEKNLLPVEALGLSFSRRIFLNLLVGLLIGTATLALIAAMLYGLAPFHLGQGPLRLVDALKESCSYFAGNSLEELMFRGFLLVVLSRSAGWRIAVLILALPFGLFHLQGSGISPIGLKMVASTATYSLVLSLSYILTRSMWTAISVHVTSNILLHTLLGLDGMGHAMFVPVFSGSGSGSYDRGFFGAMIPGALAMTCLLYRIASYRLKNAAEYEFWA